jgi:hypothetical protein
MSGRDVDAIWAQLKAKAAPKAQPTTKGQADLDRIMRQLNNGMGMQEVAADATVTNSNSFTISVPTPGSTVAKAAQQQKQRQHDGTSAAAAAAAACTGEELTALLEQTLPRHMSALQVRDCVHACMPCMRACLNVPLHLIPLATLNHCLQDGGSTPHARRTALLEMQVRDKHHTCMPRILCHRNHGNW